MKYHLKKSLYIALIVSLTVLSGGVSARDCLYAGLSYPGGVLKADPMDGVWNATGGPAYMNRIQSILFVPPSTLFAAGAPDFNYNDLIVVSPDFGMTWQSRTATWDLGNSSSCSELIVASNGDLYAAGDLAVYRSDNMGESWTETGVIPGSEGINALIEIGPATFLAGTGPDGRIYRTTDGGASWYQAISVSSAESVTAMLKVDDSIVIAGTSYPGVLAISNTAGLTWIISPAQIPDVQQFQDFLLRPDGIIVAACNMTIHEGTGAVWYSEDNGVSWMPTPELNVFGVYDLVQGSDGYTYVSTEYPGGVYKWQPGSTGWVEVGSMMGTDTVESLYLAPCEAPTPTPTFTPRPTATPWENGGTSGSVSSGYIFPGERCLFTVGIHNDATQFAPGEPAGNDFKLFVVLDIGGEYWFWDGWTQEIDYVLIEDMPPGTTETIQIMDFAWPDIEGWFWRVRLWTALLYADTDEMYGDFDFDDFEYGSDPGTPTPEPDATATPSVGELLVQFNNDDSPVSYECGDERLYCFGDQHFPTDHYRVATLKNTGGAVISVNTAFEGSDSDQFEVEESTAFQLDPGANRDLRVRFNPSGVPGMKYGSIRIEGPGPTQVIEFQGHFVY